MIAAIVVASVLVYLVVASVLGFSAPGHYVGSAFWPAVGTISLAWLLVRRAGPWLLDLPERWRARRERADLPKAQVRK